MSNPKADCADTMFRLGSMDSELRKLQGQFTKLVEHANSSGSAQISATLYKLIDDVIYLREVAPNIVAALSENF